MTTEERIHAAFGAALRISHPACARLIGCDVKTLRKYGDARRILYGLDRSRRVYTESAVREYLRSLESGQWQSEATGSIGTPRAPTGRSTSNTPALDFVAARARRTAQKRAPSSKHGASSSDAG